MEGRATGSSSSPARGAPALVSPVTQPARSPTPSLFTARSPTPSQATARSATSRSTDDDVSMQRNPLRAPSVRRPAAAAAPAFGCCGCAAAAVAPAPPAAARDGRALASVVVRVALPRATALAGAAAIEAMDWQQQVAGPALRAGLHVRAFSGVPPPHDAALCGCGCGCGDDAAAGGVGLPRSVFLQLYAPVSRLLVEAARMRVALLLDADALAAADVAENVRLVDEEGMSFDVRGADSEHIDMHIPAEQAGACACACTCIDGAALDPYTRIHAPFVQAKAALYAVDACSGGLLSEAHALRLLLGVLEAGAHVDGGAGLDLDLLRAHGRVLRQWYPAHTEAGRARLRAEWPVWLLPWQVPVQALRDYMGERVAFYFLFLGILSKFMIAPAVVGAAVFVHQLVSGDPNVIYLPVYGFCVAVWATLFCEMWKREQARTAQKWGTVGYSRQEPLRPEYAARAVRVRSAVDGKPTYSTDVASSAARRTFSASVTGLLLGCVIVGIGSIFVLRVVLSQQAALAGYGDYVTSIINAIWITALNSVYTSMAHALTAFENHPTDSAHTNHLVTKIAVFQLLNTFFGLTYTAFIKSSLVLLGQPQLCQANAAGAPDCLFDMQQQLGILIGMRIAFTIIFDLLLPQAGAVARAVWMRCRECGSAPRRAADARWRAAVAASPLEAEALQPRYDPFDDYLNLMLLFGYATLFAVAFPLAPAVVAVAVALNLYLDRNLILFVAARPTPDGAASIGAWLPVFEAISLLCAVTNLGVVVFSNPNAPVFGFAFTYTQRLVFFIAAEHLVIAIKIGIARFFADVTPRTALQLQRQAYLVDKHINGVVDVVVPRRGMDALVRARSSMRAATRVDGGVGVAPSYVELEAASAILGSPAPRANVLPPGVTDGAPAADYKVPRARTQV